jgi:hypothetical protein
MMRRQRSREGSEVPRGTAGFSGGMTMWRRRSWGGWVCAVECEGEAGSLSGTIIRGTPNTPKLGW